MVHFFVVVIGLSLVRPWFILGSSLVYPWFVLGFLPDSSLPVRLDIGISTVGILCEDCTTIGGCTV